MLVHKPHRVKFYVQEDIVGGTQNKIVEGKTYYFLTETCVHLSKLDARVSYERYGVESDNAYLMNFELRENDTNFDADHELLSGSLIEWDGRDFLVKTREIRYKDCLPTDHREAVVEELRYAPNKQ